MAATPTLSLPLLDGAQAQKHVTVNEALTRLDAVALLTALSRSVTAPPSDAAAGDRYIVPADASGDWAGAQDQIAVSVNGGWDLVAPAAGWRAHVADEAAGAIYDGLAWRSGAIAVSSIGAMIAAEILTVDHMVGAGPTSDTAVLIPDRSIVLGVTGRVIEAIGGATSWRLGVVGAEDRYGSGLGVALNSEAHGITGAPVGYFGGTPLRLSADGGDFAGGAVRLAAHLLRLSPPRLT